MLILYIMRSFPSTVVFRAREVSVIEKFSSVQFSSVQFIHSAVCNSLCPHGLQARLPCPSPAPGVYSHSSPSSRWCHPTISSSIVLFSFCLQSFPEPSGLHFPGWLVIWCSAGLSNGRLEGDGRRVRFPSLHLLRQQLTLFSGSFFSEALRTQLPSGIGSWGQQAFSSFAPGSGRSPGKWMPSSCYHPLG